MTAHERMTEAAERLAALHEQVASVKDEWRAAIARGDDKAVVKLEATLDELERAVSRAGVAVEVLTHEAEKERQEAARAAALSAASKASQYSAELRQELASVAADLQALTDRAAGLIAVGGLVDQRHDQAAKAAAAGVAYDRIRPEPGALAANLADLARHWANIQRRMEYY